MRPGSYHTEINLNWPVDIGGYETERSPEKPILIHMTRTPCQPGLPEFDQNRAGRAELLVTPFETFERKIRDQLGRALAAGRLRSRHATSPPSPSTAGRTAMRRSGTPCGTSRLPEAQQPNVIGRAALRAHRHRQLRRRRGRLHLQRHRPGAPRGRANCWR